MTTTRDNSSDASTSNENTEQTPTMTVLTIKTICLDEETGEPIEYEMPVYISVAQRPNRRNTHEIHTSVPAPAHPLGERKPSQRTPSLPWTSRRARGDPTTTSFHPAPTRDRSSLYSGGDWRGRSCSASSHGHSHQSSSISNHNRSYRHNGPQSQHTQVQAWSRNRYAWLDEDGDGDGDGGGDSDSDINVEADVNEPSLEGGQSRCRNDTQATVPDKVTDTGTVAGNDSR